MRHSFDDDRYRTMAAEALMRGRSRELARPLPAQPEIKPRPRMEFVRITPSDGAVEEAIHRLENRNERVTKAMAAEQIRIDEVRAMPKRETRDVDVESPYGRATNGMDRVERVIDTIDLMLRSHQIDRGQEAAARKVQSAWAMAPDAIKCALCPGAGGAGPGTRSPTERQLEAANVLNVVRNSLGELDAPIIIRIAGMGWSVEDTARVVFGVRDGIKVKAYETAHVGMRLRMGLVVLARHWRIEGKGGAKVVGMRGSVAGHQNDANFGALSEAERERTTPLRSAAEERDIRLLRKAKGKRLAKIKAESKARGS